MITENAVVAAAAGAGSFEMWGERGHHPAASCSHCVLWDTPPGYTRELPLPNLCITTFYSQYYFKELFKI